jgi:aldehyde:ferredoxin oxidoreductase
MLPILSVDLTTGNINDIAIPNRWVEEYLGGASLAARFLYDYLNPGLDPFTPEAPLLFLNGPLSGTAGPAVGRFVVCGKSPATRLWGESNCGGFWGPELRKTGYDGILITGHSKDPVYLSITGNRSKNLEVEIRSATKYWGMDPYKTQKTIGDELNLKGVRVASIGMAGEALIPYSLILCDHGRVAGRTGMGAVMGSKDLKAIAVKGTGDIPIFDPDEFNILRSLANRELKSDPYSQVVSEFGTAAGAEYFDYLGEMPKRYFHRIKFPDEIEISGTRMNETVLTGKSACHACVIACGRKVRLEGERIIRKGPEYETLVGFGPNLWLNDIGTATRLGELCDHYGMDTISLSNTIGLAFWLYEKGVITEKHTGGLALEWGNAAIVEELVHLTSRRQGFGAELAEGARALGYRFGVEEEAVQVNGLEIAYHDPRGASGMALVYATSPRGGCHNQSDYFQVDIGQADTSLGLEYFEPKGGVEKTENVVKHQNWRTVFNSLVMCLFSNIGPEMVIGLINSACGFEWTINELMECGERGWNLKRVINNRLGLCGKDDRLPKAFQERFEDCDQDESCFIPEFESMLCSYYNIRGWDAKSGYPTETTLDSLGLGWVCLPNQED